MLVKNMLSKLSVTSAHLFLIFFTLTLGSSDVHLIGNYIGDHSTGPQVIPFKAPKSVEASRILVPQPVSSTAHEDSSRSIHVSGPIFLDQSLDCHVIYCSG